MFRRFTRLVAVGLPLVVAAGASAAGTRIRVAVLPVVVHSLEQQDYLQSGIADMLATRLEQNAQLAVTRVSDRSQATLDVEAARGTARAAGADFVVFGSFTRFGDGASLDLRCIPTAGAKGDDPRGVFVQAGSLGEIIPRLDEVAEKVGRYVSNGSAGTPDVAAGPPGAAPARAPADVVLQDALSELDELRARVERLESAISGRDAGSAVTAPGSGRQP